MSAPTLTEIVREVRRILREARPEASDDELDRIVRIVAKDIASDPEVAAWFMQKVNKGGLQ